MVARVLHQLLLYFRQSKEWQGQLRDSQGLSMNFFILLYNVRGIMRGISEKLLISYLVSEG